MEDYVEINLRFFDNGDDKIWVEGLSGNGGKMKGKPVMMLCNKFIPNNEPSHPILAATGSSVVLRKITIKQSSREVNPRTASSGKANCECCSLF